MTPEHVHAIFDIFQQKNPHPTTELTYTSHFELLVAVILSAQATDTGVNQATARLFAHANTPQAILALGEAGLTVFINRIGLFPTKAKNILKTCEQLIRQHRGQVPSTREALEALPGVGRKTANVILNTAFGVPVIAVDTHIFRVSHRLKLAEGKTPLAVEQGLQRVIPHSFQKNAHHWLILHGRYICTARRPQCSLCPIRAYCVYPETIGYT